MKTKPALKKLFGGFLLFFACSLAFLWFYWLAPVRNLSSSVWMGEHSARRQWIELKKEIHHRSGYNHESGVFLGMWGDKEWAAWLISEFKAERDHMDCEDGHIGTALPFITNQELGHDTNAWVAWWTTNSEKTQEEWIHDGFRKKGVELSRPMTTNNIITLLKFLAPLPPSSTSVTNTNRPSSSLRYNAFRWLRDSGVIPRDVDLESLPPEERIVATRGLVSYAGILGDDAYSPGKIFGEEYDYETRDKWFMQVRYQWGLAAFLVLLAYFGWRSALPEKS